MKNRKIITSGFWVAAISTCMNCYAVAPGLYTGIMLGSATNSAKTMQAGTNASPSITTPVTPKSTQFGSSIYLGYKMNQYASVEGGLYYFSAINYDNKGVATCSGTDVRVRSFDFVGKGELPIYYGMFNVFGKAGVAFNYVTTSGGLNPGVGGACGKSEYTTKFSPTASIGASYDLNQNWQTDISWNRIMVGSTPGNVDFYAIGIAYHFVDKYCGQFLCDD